MTLDPLLLTRVADPVDHGPLVAGPDGSLHNPRRGVTFATVDGVPSLVEGGDDASPSPIASFDGVADWYDSVMQDPQGHGPMTTRANTLLQHELTGVSGVVLDVACGTGLSVRWLRRDGLEIVGVDISTDQLRIAKHRLPVVRGDSSALPFGDRTFQAVVTSYSAAPDVVAAAAQAFRVLQPGGRYVQVHVHPVLNGSWTARDQDGTALVGARYHETTELSPDAHATTIRARVGSIHVPFDDYLQAPIAAGFRLGRIVEFSEYDGGLPTSLLTTWLKE